MKCSRCGFKDKSGMSVCVRCGARIGAYVPGKGSAAPPDREQCEPHKPKTNVLSLVMGILSILLAVVLVLMLAGKPNSRDTLAGSGPPKKTEAAASSALPSAASAHSDAKRNVITIWSFNDEVPKMCKEYKRTHPDFGFDIEPTVISTADGLYEPALDEALHSGGSADIYCVDAGFAVKYTKGEMSKHAIPYKDLGILVIGKTAAADIARYIIEVGTRPADNALVGLGYQSTAGVFIYRRSIAKHVWGTDDPDVIKTRIGPGWDKFFEAAGELKARGYGIVSGDGDIWHAVENSADKGWIVDGKLYIDPKRKAFLDYSKEFADKGYSNGTQDWTEEWYKDMAGTGKNKVFGFFGPSWFINYVMAKNCGGSTPGEGTFGDWAVCEPPAGFFLGGTWVLANKDLENDPAKKAAAAKLLEWLTLNCGRGGIQYARASGKLAIFGDAKDTAASAMVMAMADGTLPFLGGQNMYYVFREANGLANGNCITEFDSTIGILWRDQVRQYAAGNITREEALAAFKRAVKDHLGIDAL